MEHVIETIPRQPGILMQSCEARGLSRVSIKAVLDLMGVFLEKAAARWIANSLANLKSLSEIAPRGQGTTTINGRSSIENNF